MSLLSNQIWQCLDLDLLDGAELLAEQLVAHENSADAQYLLARVLLRREQPESAKLLTQPNSATHLGCAWAYARACLALNERALGIACLKRVRSKWALDNDLPLNCAYTRGELTAAAFHLLLAQLYGDAQPEKAVEEFKASARLNPYLVENVLALCQSPLAEVRGRRMFSRFADPFGGPASAGSTQTQFGTPLGDQFSSQMLTSVARSRVPHADVRSTPRNPHDDAERTFMGRRIAGLGREGANIGSHNELGAAAGGSGTGSHPELGAGVASTPQLGTGPAGSGREDGPGASGAKTGAEPGAGAAGSGPESSAKVGSVPTLGVGSTNPSWLGTSGPGASGPGASGPGASGPHASTPRRIVTPQRALTTPMTFGVRATPFHPPSAHRPAPTRENYTSFRRGDQSTLPSLGRGFFEAPAPAATPSFADGASIGLTPLIQHLSAPRAFAEDSGAGVAGLEALVDALELLSQCEFAAAQHCLAQLPEPVRATPFVLALEGRLALEQGQHDACIDTFMQLRRRQPDRVRGMELLSTALWHRQQVGPLARLGFELTNRSAHSRRMWPSWCVLGNAFSLQHDVPNAIKCFKRSLVLKPTAVAYTLLGYELMLNEELQEAVDSFSKAIRCAPQHYNAWYGLSSACYSLGALAAAEAHCAQALRINNNNTVLHCFMGTLLAERGGLQPAIAEYDRAIALDPQSAVPRFRKVEALERLGRREEALEQLLAVEQLAPEDPAVQLELAALFRQLHQGERAVQHYTKAQQLAPKNAPKIRKYLSQL